jgi:hypothetical protein
MRHDMSATRLEILFDAGPKPACTAGVARSEIE